MASNASDGSVVISAKDLMILRAAFETLPPSTGIDMTKFIEKTGATSNKHASAMWYRLKKKLGIELPAGLTNAPNPPAQVVKRTRPAAAIVEDADDDDDAAEEHEDPKPAAKKTKVAGK